MLNPNGTIGNMAFSFNHNWNTFWTKSDQTAIKTFIDSLVGREAKELINMYFVELNMVDIVPEDKLAVMWNFNIEYSATFGMVNLLKCETKEEKITDFEKLYEDCFNNIFLKVDKTHGLSPGSSRQKSVMLHDYDHTIEENKFYMFKHIELITALSKDKIVNPRESDGRPFSAEVQEALLKRYRIEILFFKAHQRWLRGEVPTPSPSS